MVDIDTFFEDLAVFARERGYVLTAQTVMKIADQDGVDIGSIIWLGRRHLIPRGWVRHEGRGWDSALYEPPVEKETTK